MKSRAGRVELCRYLATCRKDWDHLRGPLSVLLHDEPCLAIFIRLDRAALDRGLFSRNTNKSDRYYSLYRHLGITRQLMQEGKL